MTNPDLEGGNNSHRVAAAELLAFVERREKLEEDKAELAEAVKDLTGEIKSRGYDMKAFNEMLKLRKMDKDERDEREAIRSMYAEALGVFS